MVVDVEAEGSAKVVFNEFAQARFAVDVAFGSTDYVVAIRKETSGIGGGVCDHVKDVPDIFRDGQRCPLKRYAESRRGSSNGKVDIA